MKDKLILIKERHDLMPESEDNGIIYLKAPVAVFGKENGNKRIYEESNYLPLLEELKEKIKANNLTGELDHPGERLEVFLSNASHKIEELSYDKASRTVNAKIRLIEGTTAGNNAIALYKAGVKLGISSRAIGVIKDNKAILKKIITFDIVSTPGFKPAMLSAVNESLGVEETPEGVSLFEITDEKNLNKYNYLLNENINNENQNIMSSKELNMIQESLENLKLKILKIDEKVNDFANYNQSHIEKLNEFTSSILEKHEDIENFKNNFILYNEKETDKLVELKENVSLIDETMDTFISLYENYSNMQSDKLNKFVEHQDNETNKLNKFVNHQDNESNKLNKIVSYLDNQSEVLEKFVDHQDNETNKLNEVVNYLDNQSEVLEKFVDHQDNETNKLNKFVEYLDNQSEVLEKFVEHKDNETNKLNIFSEWTENNLKNLYENKIFKNHINNKKQVNLDLKHISESVDNVLKNVRKQKTYKNTILNKYPFLQVISEVKQEEFLSLDDTRKTMIVKKIQENNAENENEILKSWDLINNQFNKKNIIWLSNANKDYQKLWESLSVEAKTNITRSASLRNFQTKEDIDNFWKGLQLNEQIKLINESENPKDFDLNHAISEINVIQEDYKLGYSKEYINNIKNLIKKQK